MDTRRASGSREQLATPELGTETVRAELVELQAVGSSGGGPRPKALLATVVLGILAFGAFLATAPPPGPTPSPSVPPVALVTASPAPPIATPTVRPSTFKPTAPPPTPRPTQPPPWQWTRRELLPDLNQSAEGIWGVNDDILVLVHDYGAGDASSIVRLTGAGATDEFPAPRAIEEFAGGSVIDDRLWFLARVGGVGYDDANWQLAGTADGEAWESVGDTVALPPIDGVSFVGRAGESWVVATWRNDGIGKSIHAVSWSSDGRHWTAGDVPRMPGDVAFVQGASIGETLVIFGRQGTANEDVTAFVLTSNDGRRWRQSSVEWPATGRPDDLACNYRGCVITIDPVENEGPRPNQVVLVSADGVRWTAVMVDVPYIGAESSISSLRATETGFIALSGFASPALLSEEGRAWRAVDVLPPDVDDFFIELAVANDIVAGLVDTSSDEPAAIWLGSLSAMGN